MAEDSTISQLGGLALGNLLSEYGVDDQGRQHLGISSQSGFDSNDIYNEKYMDDEDQFRGMDQGYDEEEEEEEDQGGYNRDYGNRGEMDRYLKQGMQAIGSSSLNLPGNFKIKTEPKEDYDISDEDGNGNGNAMSMSIDGAQQNQPVPRKPKAIEELWKGFEKGKTLNFVDFYWPESMARPIKKRKLGLVEGLKGELGCLDGGNLQLKRERRRAMYEIGAGT